MNSIIPTTNPQPASGWNFQHFSKLVDYLLACPSLGEPSARQTVISQLPDSIKHNVQLSLRLSPKMEISTILDTCRATQGGLAALVEIVGFYDGETTSFTALQEYLETAHLLTPPSQSDQPDQPNPYQGLSAFTEETARFFFGREGFVDTLAAAVTQRSLIAVVGSSGSGKSSVVQAGLLPRLSAEQKGWRVAALRPGKDPLYQLAYALTRLLEPDKTPAYWESEAFERARGLAQDPRSLSRQLEQLAQKQPGGRILLFVDQFEELYTLSPHAERTSFLALLLTALEEQAVQRQPVLTVVFTLRADFFNFVTSEPRLLELLSHHKDQQLLTLGAMKPAELVAAIENPASLMDVEIEEGLTGRILTDLGERPGDLPLLEFALTLLWESRGRYNGRLTHAAYSEIGGVGQALANHAEEVYAGLTEEEQAQAEHIFTQLVTPGEGTEDTRRVATDSELGDEYWPLVTWLASQRLVVTGYSEATGQRTVEVVHEALITRWQRLRQWMSEVRGFRAWQERLRLALRQWEVSQRDEGALLRGVGLAEAEGWLAAQEGQLSQPEKEFIGASLALRDREKEEREAALAREAALERQRAEAAEALVKSEKKARQRQRLFITGLSALLLGTILASILAWTAKLDADHQAVISKSQALSAYSQSLLETNLELSGLLAAQAARLADTPATLAALPQADNALRQFLPRSSLLNILSGHSDGVYRAVFSPNGSRIVTASLDKTARLWSATDGKLLAILSGHSDSVYNAVFSPDGSRIVTASEDKTARLWSATDGKLLTILSGHNDKVISAVFSPDGSKIVTASYDKTARLWSATDGKLLTTLSGHSDAVFSAVFSPDGSKIVTASYDKTARLWSVSDGKPLATLSGHSDWVISAVFSPDGSKILTASYDKTARLWSATDGKPLTTLSGHSDKVISAVFSPDGSKIVTASQDNKARLWSADGKSVAILSGHASWVYSAVFSPDGSKILTASYDKTARLWSATDGKPLTTLSGHSDAVFSAVFSPDGSKIVTASQDNKARLWSADGSKLLTTLSGHNDKVTSAVFSPDGSKIVTASEDKTARLWSASDGKLLTTLSGHSDKVTSAVFSPDGSKIVTASWDKTARLWSASDGKPLAILSGHSDKVYNAVFSPDGSRIVTASEDKTARLWSATDGKLLAILSGHSDSVYSAVFSPDGSKIVTASWDKTARLWSATDGKLLTTLSGHSDSVYSAAFSPDGSKLLTTSEDKTARLWSADGIKLLAILSGHSNAVFSAVFSPDGSKIVTASWDKTARLWSATDGKLLAILSGHSDKVYNAIFSPDGSRIVTASLDKTARLWSASDGKPLAILSDLSSAAFSPDGSKLLTTSEDKTAIIEPTNVEDLIKLVETHVTRPFTEEEKQLYGL